LLGDVPFPLVFGASGGEDSVLFRSLSRSGARIVFAPEAAVEERIPRDRVRLPWLLQRAFREGLIVGRRERHFGARSPAIVVIIVRALAKVVVGGVEVAIGLGRGSSAAAVAGAWRILTGLGTIGGLADLRSSPYGVRR
jgi:succinoglycan biosynthesis protein ExoM